MKKETYQSIDYESPRVETLKIVMEQVIASSVNNGSIDDMEIYEEW